MSHQNIKPVGHSTERNEIETCIAGEHVLTYGKGWAVGIYKSAEK